MAEGLTIGMTGVSFNVGEGAVITAAMKSLETNRPEKVERV